MHQNIFAEIFILTKNRKEKKYGKGLLRFWCFLHNLILSPWDTVSMEILRGIEPETISFFSSYVCASISINICLNSPVFSSDVSQELKVYFVMVLLEYVPIRHLSSIRRLFEHVHITKQNLSMILFQIY